MKEVEQKFVKKKYLTPRPQSCKLRYGDGHGSGFETVAAL